MHLKGNDFLKLLDYTPEQIDYLLNLAAKLKAEYPDEEVRDFGEPPMKEYLDEAIETDYVGLK